MNIEFYTFLHLLTAKGVQNYGIVALLWPIDQSNADIVLKLLQHQWWSIHCSSAGWYCNV